MEEFIGCDAHKEYSVFVSVNERGEAGKGVRVEHARESVCTFLNGLRSGSRIAVEASGYYYWILDQIESAGHQAFLANPREAKRRMGRSSKKTDKIDARGLATLLRNGTLPTVWIPPAELRDQRELLRLRMYLAALRRRWKTRIQASLGRYNLRVQAVKDAFCKQGRREIGELLRQLPQHTRASVEQQLTALDFVELQVAEVEERLEAVLASSAEADLLKTLPCVGTILSAVMALEIGAVARVPERRASGQLRWLGPAHSFQRWKNQNGIGLWRC